MKEKISTLVGLRNNLEYSKHFYKQFRNIYPNEELVFVSYGSTDDTDKWLDSLNDPFLKYFHSKEDKTFSDTYNKCAEIATNDYIVFAHNDMVIAPDWLENISKYSEPDSAVGYTTVEPPIFPSPRVGKVLLDFGDDFDSFNSDFFEWCKNYQNEQKGKLEDGVTFFMSLNRNKFLEIGGFDNLFKPMFLEDTDLGRRIQLLNLQQITSRDSIVYHFVSKTSRFSEEYKEKTKIIEYYSIRNFLRKWGSFNIPYRFNVSFHINNCNPQFLRDVEPRCDMLYTDCNSFLVKDYIKNEQPHTSYNLLDKIHPYAYKNMDNNDFIISFDANLINKNNVNIIENIYEVLSSINEEGEYEFGFINIKANKINNIINDLIFIPKQIK